MINNTELETAQRELTNYIFFKTFTTWGEQKFNSTFGTGDVLNKIKRDWQPDLMDALYIRIKRHDSVQTYSIEGRSRIDSAFKEIRYNAITKENNTHWPDLKTVCYYLRKQRSETEPQPTKKLLSATPDKTKAQRQQTGLEILSEIRKRFTWNKNNGR